MPSTEMATLSRTEVVEISTRYIHSGLINVEPAKVPMAPDCFRVENGLHCGDSPEGINIGLSFKKDITAATDLRWVVDGQEAVVFLGLHHGERINYLTEYFRLSGNLINEIRPVFFSKDFRPGRYPNAKPETDLRAAPPPLQKGPVVQLASDYLNSWAQRQPEGLPLGWDVTVKENGRFVARGETEARQHLKAGFYGRVSAVKVAKWLVEGSQLAAYFEAKTNDGWTYTGWQLLRAYDGSVKELEANYCIRTS